MQTIPRAKQDAAPTPPLANVPKVKGVSLRGLISSVRRSLGQSTLDAMVKMLPPDLARAVRTDAFYSTSWYPLTEYYALQLSAQRATGRGPELARELGRDAILDDFRGIYKVLLSVLSPEFLFKRSPMVFSRYYDTGKLEITRAEHGVADARFTGCTGFNQTLWEDTLGGCLGLLEACGARNVEMTIHEGGEDGDDHLYGTATWK
jgi:hypothetical protein